MPPCGWLLARRVPTRGDGLTDALVLLRRKCNVGADRHFPASVHLFEGCKWIPKLGTLHPSMVRIAATAFVAARK